MFNKIKIRIKNKNEIFALACLLVLTISLTSYYNLTKEKIKDNYKEIINNIYFKKTTSHFFNKLEPKFKKIRHQISEGETLDNILNQYQINQKEILNLKKKISEKINLNKLNTNQKIYLTIDQADNKIKSFIFQISNKEKIYLSRNETNEFSQEIILTKLDKKIVYQENIILLQFVSHNKHLWVVSFLFLENILRWKVWGPVLCRQLQLL